MAEQAEDASAKAGHRIAIKEAFEGRHGNTYKEVKEKYRNPETILDSFQVALELLEILFANKEIHHNENKSKRIRQQLQNQMVAVSVLGRHGVGKSTMLDALLGERVLPTHRKNNTAVMVMIQHQPDLENGPRLLDADKNVLASGREDIAKYITNENNSVRSSEKKKSYDLHLELNCPILKSEEGGAKPVLVDTPGFEEAGAEHIDLIAAESLEGSSACLLVMSYTMLRDRGDLSILQQLHNSDPGLSNGRRIVIAVTQHDHYYTGKNEEELSAMATRDHVHEGLLEVGYMVPKQQIVIVSGEWALMARELASNPADKPVFQRARKFLTFYKDVQAIKEGQEDYDAFVEVAAMDPATVAKELEEASNIKDLEARIVELSGRCNDILLSSAKNKIGYYLQQALDELNVYLETACNKYQEEQREEEHVKACVKELSTLKAAIEHTTVAGEENEVYSSLKEKVDRESEVACGKTQKAIRRKLAQLRAQCLEKVQLQVYTTQMYHEDLNSVEEDLGVTLRHSLHSALYSRSQSKSTRYLQYKVPHSFYRLESVVRELGGASDVPRMQSTPEPEPPEEEVPVVEEDREEEEEEPHVVAADTVGQQGEVDGEEEGEGEGKGEGEGEGEGSEQATAEQEESGAAKTENGIESSGEQSKGTSEKGPSTESSGDDKGEGKGEGEGGEDEEDGSVNVAGMMGDKEEQLHLRQLVEAHQISMPPLRRYTSWKKFKLYMRIMFGRRKTTDPTSMGAARRSKYRQVQMQEEEVSQGFRDIMEAYKEEVTALFYWDNTGIRDQVFTHFYTEYRTDVEQRLATFQAKYGGIIDRQSTILKEANERMGELAEKVQDLEYITERLESTGTWFKPSIAIV